MKTRTVEALPLFAWAKKEAPDYIRGRCECGWILAGWQIQLLDEPQGRTWLRHLTALPLA